MKIRNGLLLGGVVAGLGGIIARLAQKYRGKNIDWDYDHADAAPGAEYSEFYGWQGNRVTPGSAESAFPEKAAGYMDRTIRGFIAGITGGIAMNTWTLFAVYILKWKIIRFIDWAGVILYGNLPQSHLEGAVALLVQLMMVGSLGVLMAFYMTITTSRAYLFKGVLFGFVVGFVIYAIPTIFQVPILSNASVVTVISNQTGGFIWALTTAYMLRRLDTSPRLKN